MVDFYSTKPSVKAPRKRTHKPKGKTGLQQLQAEVADEALALATPTPPSTGAQHISEAEPIQTPTNASSSLPPSIPPVPTPPLPPGASSPVEKEEIEPITLYPDMPAAVLRALLASAQDPDPPLDPTPPANPRHSTRQPTRGKPCK
jgi:hypothetical protein